MNDYPKLGVWPDGIYMSANMFTRAKTYAGVKVWALNRADMISGAAMRNVAFTLGTTYFTLYPSTVSSTFTVPDGTPNYFMSLYAPSTMRMWKFHVDWGTLTNSTFTGPTAITVASFTKPTTKGFVPQLGTTVKLDTLGDRLMVQMQFTNVGGVPALWFSHSVLSSSVTGIRWYEIRNMATTPTVYQQGTYQPDSLFRWMPSLAVDVDGNMAVGYSVSSTGMYPAIRYAGRLATDALGTLGQGEATLIAGTGSQTSYTRWGDYSAMVLDPNGCTFWYTTEYYLPPPAPTGRRASLRSSSRPAHRKNNLNNPSPLPLPQSGGGVFCGMMKFPRQAGWSLAFFERQRKVRTPQSRAPGNSRVGATLRIGPQRHSAPSLPPPNSLNLGEGQGGGEGEKVR